MDELHRSLELVSKMKGNIWLLGNFNMSKLDRPDRTPVLKEDPSCRQVYEFFLDIINDLSFCQMVTETTRNEKCLDLFLITNHTVID